MKDRNKTARKFENRPEEERELKKKERKRKV